MSDRCLTVLGTAAQMPTKDRNHNGLFLKWDGYGFLIDPGEGTQQQLSRAGISTSKITDILITHFHGDHCLGLPGVIQRMSIDGVTTPVRLTYPESGTIYLTHLIDASIYQHHLNIHYFPVTENGHVHGDSHIDLTAAELSHRVDTYGYQIRERPKRTLIPGKLKQYDLGGPEISQLVKAGRYEQNGKIIRLEDVSAEKPGQSVAVVMDTSMCKNAYRLAEEVDLLICESTYLHSELELAKEYGHLTARQAATLASKKNVKQLVLTHFSQRYATSKVFEEEARRYFNNVIAAEDLERVDIPRIKRKT